MNQLSFSVSLAALCRLGLFLESSFHSDVVCSVSFQSQFK